MKAACNAGVIATERGGALGYLHCQGVVRLAATSPQSVSAMLKRALGWANGLAPPGAIVMCRKLTGRVLHTWHGLIGYCLKDQDQPHFRCVMHNITSEDAQAGIEAYVQLGAGPLKNKTMLTPSNLYKRALVYFQMHYKGDKNSCTFQDVLMDMCRTGKYYPSASWVIPFQGKGMSHERAAALWRIMVAPSSTTATHIHKVFFFNGTAPEWGAFPNDRGRYFDRGVQPLLEEYFASERPLPVVEEGIPAASQRVRKDAGECWVQLPPAKRPRHEPDMQQFVMHLQHQAQQDAACDPNAQAVLAMMQDLHKAAAADAAAAAADATAAAADASCEERGFIPFHN